MHPAESNLSQAALDMLVLQTVSAGPLHGFDITQRLDLMSGDAFRMPRASIYPTLHRLEGAGLLAGSWQRLATGREAKFYRLTRAGRARLKDAAGWALLSDAVSRIAALQHELRTAAAIQRALLPNTHRTGPFFDAAASTAPCRSIGGDFFDYYVDLPDGALGFALGDVAGKGPPAALLAALTQGSLAALALASDGPAATVAAVNAAIVRRGIRDRFVTLFYGVLHADGRLAYCNAGHNPPILARAAGGIDRLAVGGMVIGIFDGVRFTEGAANLRADDHLVVFSDGVSEALNAAEEEFGDDRLVASVAGVPRTGAEPLLQHVFADVKRFTAGAAQHDDVTAMVVAYRAPGGVTAGLDPTPLRGMRRMGPPWPIRTRRRVLHRAHRLLRPIAARRLADASKTSRRNPKNRESL